MNRDFGMHFAAWFLLGTLVVLVGGFLAKANNLISANVTGAEIFCYSFIAILSVAFAGALLDILVFCDILDRLKKRG